MVMVEEDECPLQSGLSLQGIPESCYNPTRNDPECETTERWCNTPLSRNKKRGTQKQKTPEKDG
jgi:hypothetical protein